jgi:hypothetical protein
VKTANLLRDIVQGKVKCFPLNSKDKSSLAKLTILPKKESSLKRCYFPAIKLS